MLKRLKAGIAILLVLTLSILFTAGSLGDAGSFSGDSDWGSSDFGSSDWGGSDWSGSDSGTTDWGSGSSDFGAGWVLGSTVNEGGYSNSDSDYSSTGSGGCRGDSILLVVVLVIIAIIVFNFFRKSSNNNGANVYQAAQEDAGLPLSVLKEKDPNFNEQALVEKIGNDYMQMQQAWQNKDWEPMRALMTDTLYNQMARQLDELKQRGVTNKVERIAVLNAVIRRYAVEGDNDVLTVRLNTRICDYTVNDKTGQVVQGNPNKELFMTYDWKLIRQKDKKTLERAAMTEVNCPNCGAPLSINHSGKCPYCDTVVTLSDHDWALSVIKGIAQRSA